MAIERPAENAVFELVAFLVSGARGAPEEGPLTASLRLIDAAGRLSRMAGTENGDPFLEALGDDIGASCSARYLESEESFLAYLDEVLATVAAEVRARNGLAPLAKGARRSQDTEA